MTDCEKDALRDITSDCTTPVVGGAEKKSWLIHRKHIEAGWTVDATNNSIITDFSIITGEKAQVLKTAKAGLTAGHTKVPAADGFPQYFTHTVGWKNFEKTGAATENIDNLRDMVHITETIDKEVDGDGTFEIRGLKRGLFVTEDTRDLNTDKGVRPVTLASEEGGGEDYAKHTLHVGSYAATLAFLEALEIAQA